MDPVKNFTRKPLFVVAWLLLIIGLSATAPASDPLIYAAQERLTALGYDPGPIDGYTGSKTQSAIESFQNDHGLSPSGALGPQTRAALGIEPNTGRLTQSIEGVLDAERLGCRRQVIDGKQILLCP